VTTTLAMSRAMLVTTLIAIAVLAAAPFLLAQVVAESRRIVAAERAEVLARAVADVETAAVSNVRVLVGAGNLPRLDSSRGWEAGGTSSLAPLLDPALNLADPWRNAFLVNIGATGAVRALSAGPNGIVDTPFESQSVRGDDIAAPVLRRDR
jgi:hypothetical protein